MIPITAYVFILFELIGVAYIDIKEKKISNHWFVINLIFFMIFLFLFPELYKLQLNTFIYPLAFISVGFVLFALKIMGAGDAKYLFSFFLLVPKSLQDHFFVTLLWVTIIVGLSSIVITIIQNFSRICFSIRCNDIRQIKEIFGSKFPYAPIILISWIWIGWVFRLEFLGIEI